MNEGICSACVSLASLGATENQTMRSQKCNQKTIEKVKVCSEDVKTQFEATMARREAAIAYGKEVVPLRKEKDLVNCRLTVFLLRAYSIRSSDKALAGVK